MNHAHRDSSQHPTSQNHDVLHESSENSVVPDHPHPLNAEMDNLVANINKETVQHHPFINGLPCDADGTYLPPGSPLPSVTALSANDFSPFKNRTQFRLANLLYRKSQVSGSTIDELMDIWAESLDEDHNPPFLNKQHLYSTIDTIKLGDAPWQSFTVSYDGDITPSDNTPWKHEEYEVFFRDPRVVLHNQLSNPDFSTEMDFSAKRVTDDLGNQRYCDLMSGNWAWRQSDILAKDPINHGSTFCPIILGSDKTTVSVATGQNDYYPLYMSNGLVHNNARRAHRNALGLIAFLAIPKTSKDHEDSDEFRKFRRQLFHGSIETILQTLKPGMTERELVKYADGFYRWTIYGLGPYIADYPEQVLLACIVQNWCPGCDAKFNDLDKGGSRRSHALTEALMDTMDAKTLWDDYGIVDGIMPFSHRFPRGDIHETLSPDLLHQIIKGTFKDHLVTWVTAYIEKVHAANDAKRILADIDRRIAATPLFPGLRQFHQGRGFKQWTGDDSKNLMKIYLPAIAGHVPWQMVQAISAFLEFCYLVRRSVIDDDNLLKIDAAVSNFHKHRVAFDLIRPDGYSLPRQHSMTHYVRLIRDFGAPNGLCSSITESKHIKAVKEPWRRSSCFEALGQMLVTNQRLDKLAAAHVDFAARGMLHPPSLLPPAADGSAVPSNQQPTGDDDETEDVDEDVDAETLLARKPIPHLPFDAFNLGAHLGIPDLHDHLSRFIYKQTNPNDERPIENVPSYHLPSIKGKVRVFPSATSTYYAPSDKSGLRGMLRERIRCVNSWRKGPGRRDTVYVSHDSSLDGFRGLLVARVRLFMSVVHHKLTYPCALVEWFSTVGEEPCPETGMWTVEPDIDVNDEHMMEVIHLDTIVRGAHLIGAPQGGFIPTELRSHQSLDAFSLFYVNKYVDYHSHEIAF